MCDAARCSRFRAERFVGRRCVSASPSVSEKSRLRARDGVCRRVGRRGEARERAACAPQVTAADFTHLGYDMVSAGGGGGGAGGGAATWRGDRRRMRKFTSLRWRCVRARAARREADSRRGLRRARAADRLCPRGSVRARAGSRAFPPACATRPAPRTPAAAVGAGGVKA